jgi:hypothetical protein
VSMIRTYRGDGRSPTLSRLVVVAALMPLSAASIFAQPPKAAGAAPAAGQPAPAQPGDVAAVPIETRSGEGTPYYVLPVHGVFGLEVSNAVISDCYRAAEQAGAQIVVLEIDSPGGSVAELKRILATLDRHRGLRTVAYVKEAKSAAAILALACREIIMAERAQIGAAVPFTLAPDGTPRNIAAKFESALRADFRSAAELGGHNPLLAEGMMRDDLLLSLRQARGGYKIVEGPGDKVLKKHGEILTLTTHQALECGLALGARRQIADCAEDLEIEEWFEVTDHGRERVAAWVREIRQAMDKFRTAWKNAEQGYNDAVAHARQGRRQNVTDALRRAENNLRRAEELAGKYPGLGDDDSVRELRNQLQSIRKSIERP